MTESIVFISHFRIKEGKLDALRALIAEVVAALETEKPRTLAYLHYLDEGGQRWTVAHVFPDAQAMDRHFEGADVRSAAAFEFAEPTGWEIYGPASAEAVATIQAAADVAGVRLEVAPRFVEGFLRSSPR